MTDVVESLSNSNPVNVPNRLQSTIRVHKGPVHIAKFNSTGKYFLTGGFDRKIHLFNATATEESSTSVIKTYPSTIHSGPILTIDIAKDNASFVSAGQDRNVIVWDVSSGEILRKFANHSGAIHSTILAGNNDRQDILLTAGDDRFVRIYDLRAKSSFKPLMEIKDAKDTIVALAFHQNQFWSGSMDGCLRMYDIRKGEVQQDTIDRPITSITPSQTGSSLLVSISGDEATSEKAKHIIFDVQDGSHLQTVVGGKNTQYRCNSTLWSNDSTILAGDENGEIAAWDIVTGEKVKVWKNAHEKSILWIDSTAKNGGKMVSASADGTVKVWSCE